MLDYLQNPTLNGSNVLTLNLHNIFVFIILNFNALSSKCVFCFEKTI